MKKKKTVLKLYQQIRKKILFKQQFYI
jgi:hypothetical protein